MTIRSTLSAARVLVIGGVLGCAANSDYIYQPDTANAMAAGLPAARTPIPQEAPQGAIEVTSYGVTELQRDGMKIPALHVRAIVTNDGDAQPWTLDTTKQLVEIPGEGSSRPIFANADVGTLPSVAIALHERRVIDLYYALPDPMRSARQLPRFDVLWQVNTPARTVASRTSFDRVDRAPAVAAEYEVAPWPVWAGFGPYWWYDPFYPRVVFIHAHPYHLRGNSRVVVGGFGGRFHAGRPHVVHR